MTKDEILRYATESPQNTNKAVLSTMLDQLNTSNSTTVTETTNVIMPAQYVTITDADVEVTDVDMSGLQNEGKLLFEILVEGEYNEQISFTIKYGDGEAHTTTNEMIGVTEGGLHVTVKKVDDVWKLKVTNGYVYVPGSYIIRIIKIDILDALDAYPRENNG